MNQPQQDQPDAGGPHGGLPRRYWPTFLVVWLATSVVAAATYFLLYFQFPLYTADALIECLSNQPGKGFTLREHSIPDKQMQRFVRSQAELAVSAPVINEVLLDAEVRETEWFRTTPPQHRQSRLVDGLTATAIDDTNYLQISFSARNPTDAKTIVNVTVNVYLTITRDLAATPYRQQLAESKREHNDLKDRMNRNAAELHSYSLSFPAPMVGPDLTPLLDTYAATQARLDETDAALAGTQAYALRLELPTTPDSRAELEPLLAEDAAYARHAGEYAQQRFECEKLRMASTNGAPDVSSEIAACTQLQDWLVQQMDSRVEELKRAERGRAQFQIEQLQQTRVHLAERAAEQSAAVLDARNKLVDYEHILQEQRDQQDLAQQISVHIRDLDRIVRERDAIRVRAAVQATEPTERSFPRPWLLVAMLGFSLLLSSIFAWSARRRAAAQLN